MITILIAGNSITDNERIAGSIIGGTELTTCIICTRSATETLDIIERRQQKIDLFIITIKMKEQSGYRLAEKIRSISEYRDCPILFVTNLSDMIRAVDDDLFLRCHRSFALNIRHLKGVEKVDRRIWKAVFESGKGTCLISSSYIDHVLDKYKSFQGK